MKKIIVAGLLGLGVLGSAQSFAATSKYPCDQVLFEAVTANGKKEVKFCISGKGVSYTFGKVKSFQPDLDIRKPFSQVGFTYWRGGMAQALRIQNGNYAYGVSGGLDVDTLTVEKAGQEISNIQLGKVIENNIYMAGDYPIEDLGI